MALRPPRAGIGVSRRLSERNRQGRAAETPAAAAPEAGAGVLGGMVEALQNLVTQLSRTAQDASERGGEAASPSSGGGSFSLGSGGSRAVFGYTLRMGLDGVRAEPFGDVPEGADGAAPAPSAPAPSASAAASAAARQPIVDVFEEPGAVVVIAELPGADPAGLVCRVEGGALLIEAAGTRRYRKRVALPVAVRPDALRQSFQNGILEVRLVPA